MQIVEGAKVAGSDSYPVNWGQKCCDDDQPYCFCTNSSTSDSYCDTTMKLNDSSFIM